jgi:hypothetical protein
VIRLWAGGPEFDSWQEQGYFSLALYPDWSWGPPSILSILSLGEKQLMLEADYSPPSVAKVKNAGSYTSTPSYSFMVWCLVKQ